MWKQAREMLLESISWEWYLKSSDNREYVQKSCIFHDWKYREEIREKIKSASQELPWLADS